MCEMGDTGEQDLERTCNTARLASTGACFCLFLHLSLCFVLSRLPDSLEQLLVALTTPNPRV